MKGGLSDAALELDAELAEIAVQYEFLPLLQPTNTDEAWEAFRASGFDREPPFEYPDLDLDLNGLRERLNALAPEGIGDPALLYFLTAKRDELDLELTLLGRRGTDTFLAGSIRLFGPVQQDLLREAERLLEQLDPHAGSRDEEEEVGPEEVRRLAENEFEHYRSRDSSFSAELKTSSERDGFMASDGDLLMPSDMRLTGTRARALIQHEIGVHLVTSHNGSKQPLRLLRNGLSSYDEVQEAFGALAEYLVDGLTATRMRTLAGRVIACRMTEQQLDFRDIFRCLTRDWRFGESAAFRIAARVHQSGGFSRDQIYLRGLRYLLRYIAAGGALEPLYIGKVGHAEIPMIHDLRKRGVLREPPLRPRFLELDGAEERLRRIRDGAGPLDLVRK